MSTEYKPFDGPRWVKNARVGRGDPWNCKRIEDNGRTIYWQHYDGRTGKTVCTLEHPDYPADLTEFERRQLARAAKGLPALPRRV
jgi:hypothetical protein